MHRVFEEEDHQRLIDKREEGIDRIAKGIIEIAEINQDVNTIVHEQGAVILIIENNVESARDNLKDANVELGGAENYQKKHNRKCFYIMFAVVLILLLMLVLIILFRQ